MRLRTAGCLLLVAVSLLARQPIHSHNAMVVAQEPLAADVGLAVLKSGGNAIDAAVAVGFALAVTHPSAGNIGGGGFMLVRMADGRTAFIDFRERAPQKASRNMYLDSNGKATDESTIGYRASGVPGTVRGLEYANQKYGKKQWAELVRPAVELASKGFPLSYGTAQSFRIFLREGKFYEAGDTFVQPELGRTLDRIMRLGAKDFYEGETARLLAKDMADHGGMIELADLK